MRKTLCNYEALVESEYERQQWLQERMYEHANDGEDHLTEFYWIMTWRQFHTRVFYHRSKRAIWEKMNTLRLRSMEFEES